MRKQTKIYLALWILGVLQEKADHCRSDADEHPDLQRFG